MNNPVEVNEYMLKAPKLKCLAGSRFNLECQSDQASANYKKQQNSDYQKLPNEYILETSNRHIKYKY